MDSKNLLIFGIVTAGVFLISSEVIWAQSTPDRGESDAHYESKFVEAQGIHLHYLDFGGSGLQVLFLHGVHGDATNFAEFAPRFADEYRVLAVTRRGWGKSESPPWGYDVATQSEDVLAFLDALGLEKTVLISNSRSPELIYIAEHHPERLSGLVFLDHLEPMHWGGEREPLRTFWEMNMRGACADGVVTEEASLFRPRRSYRPHFIDDESLRIDIPTLGFVNRYGERTPERYDYLASTLKKAATDAWCDPMSKEYFAQLAQDPERLAEMREALAEMMNPAPYTRAFARALGQNLEMVRLDVFGVTGYEYQRAPDLVYPHIRQFLDAVRVDEGF